MSRTIDERVVEMQFDHQQFETGVKTTMSSLDKLKDSLNFDGASKGFDRLGNAASGVDMNPLAYAVETVRSKFSALEVMAITALMNITNSAVDAGKRMLSSLTIDQVSAGFNKYEEKVQSVQTIMAATGKDIDSVNSSLEKLIWFTDETSYSFVDMTSNIGKFTAQGVDLDVSVTAMQGIATMAALSGQNADAASRAMYNFSQALGVGAVKLQDWKSIENANLATQEFKQVIIDTAIELGTLDANSKTAKGTLVDFSNFSSTLAEGWFDSDVLTASLEKYGSFADEVFELATSQGLTAAQAMDLLSDGTMTLGERAFRAAQEAKTFTDAINATKDAVSSGWMTTFEILFGNYVEAKELWTDLANAMWDIFASGAEARNEMLEGWKDLGGRDSAIQAFINSFEALSAVVTPIKDAFRDIFPATTSEQLFNMTKGLEEFTAKLKMGEETADKVQRTFRGLFAVLDLIKQAVGFALKTFGQLISLFGGPGLGGILDVTASIGDFLVKLRDAANEADIFNISFERVQAALMTFADKIRDAIQRVSDAFRGFKKLDLNPLDKLGDKATKATKPFEALGRIFGAAFEAIVKVLEWVAPIVSKLGSVISQGLTKLADTVGNAVANMNFNEILDLLNAGLFGAILYAFRNFINSLSNITSGAGGFLSGITGILDGVRGSLEAFQSSLKAKALLTIATAIGILAAALMVLSLIDSEKLSVGLMAITVLFIELTGAMIILQKAMGVGGMAKVSMQMVAMATAILILSSALKKLSALDWGEIARGTAGIAALAAVLVIAANSLDKSTKGLVRGSVGLIAFATAILIMSSAVTKLATLKWEELAVGLTALTVILAEVVLVTRLMGDPKRMISTGIGVVALGAAILIFAEAVKRMGQLEWIEIARGLTTMAGALTAVTIAMNFMPKGMITKAAGVTIMAAAMLIMAEAVKKFGSMQWAEIGRGLTVMAGALAAITIAMNLMPKGILTKAVAITILSAALLILGDAVIKMASMQWEEIGRGLTVLAGSMAILVVSLNLMRKAIPGAAAMLIVAPALMIMATVLKTLGSMPLTEIGVGLLALAGVFATLGLAALILQPLVPTIFALAGAIALMGIGVAAVGAGVLAFSAGLTALAVAATSAAGAIVVIGSAILSLIPVFFEEIGKGIIALGGVIINGAPIIKDAFFVLLESALTAFTEAVPMIANAVLTLVIGILDALDANLPQVVDKLFGVVIAFLDTVAANLPALIAAGANILGAFLEGVFTAMGGYQPENLANVLLCFTLLVASFAVLAAAKKLAKDAIIAAGAMAVVMAIIAAIFIVIAAFDIDNILSIALSLSAVLLAVSASMVILSLVPVPAALSAVAGLGVFVGGLGAVLLALGGLAQIPGLEWLVGEGARMMATIGGAIGEFAGSIVGGFLGGVSDSFPKIASDLSAFMENITPFVDGAKNLDASAMNGVKALAETILILTGAGILDGLTSWLTGGSSMVQFGEQLAEFAPHFMEYYNAIKDVDGGVVEASANAALALANFATNIPNEGGLLAKITGENSITQFAAELVKFGPALMEYANGISGLDGAAVEASANAAMALTQFADEIPNSGGLLGKITGENSIVQFANELAIFGPKLKEYADSVAGLDGASVEASANAAMALARFADEIPDSGGLVAKITGENSITRFAMELSLFGPALMEYANGISGLDANVVTNSANAAMALARFADEIPDSGGLVALFKGDNSLAKFGWDLAEFGAAFGTYYSHIQDVSLNKTRNVVASVNDLVGLASNISGTNLSGLKTFAQDLEKQGDLGITKFLSAFENASGRANTAITTFIGFIVSGISSGQTAVVTQTNVLITAMVDEMRSQFDTVSTAGQEMVASLSAGIILKQPSAIMTVTALITAMTNVVKTQKAGWISAGAYMVDGLIVGIQQRTPSAITAARTLAARMLTAVKSELGVASPAKELIKVGQFSADGLGVGLLNGIVTVVKASQKLGGELLNGIQSFLGIHSPSTVARDEVGRYFVQGIAEGIAEDTSAEDAATKKAQNIINAFKTELDKFSLDAATVDLEYKLWDTLYGATASESEKKAAKMAILQEKIALQTEKVALAEGEYLQMIQTFGESSQEAQVAYNKFLSEQISLAEMINEINGYQQTASVNQKDAMQAYSDWMRENQKMLADMGFTLEEIEAAAREHSGFNPAAMQNNMASEVSNSVTGALDTVGQAYRAASEGAFGGLVSDFTDWGIRYAGSISEGVVLGTPSLIAGVQDLSKNTTDTLKRRRPEWSNSAAHLVDGFSVGIRNKTPDAVRSAVDMAVAALNAALNAIGANSPATEFIKVGEYADMGFAVGLQKYSGLVEDSATDLGNKAENTLSNSLSDISHIFMLGMDDLTPTIRPVIDASDVERGLASIGGMIAKKQVLNLDESFARATKAVSSSSGSSRNKSDDSTGQSFSFTQNNYSPKALSRTDIYRQTKNQFSAIRERVGK